MPESELDAAQHERLARLWWSVPAATVLLLLALAPFLGGDGDPVTRGTSFDAGNTGFRAVYLLLESLKFPVERSRRPTGGETRWVLSPTPSQKETLALDSWVRSGGVLLLATTSVDYARGLGVELEIKASASEKEGEEGDAEGGEVARLARGKTSVLWSGRQGRVWASAGGEPFVTVYSLGEGELWLVNRPQFLTNELLPRADNAVLACRLAEATLAGRSGGIAFDEYVHGLRDRPGVIALLLRPPALWMTLQLLLVTAILLWHHAPRFGPLQIVQPPRRRSVEEYLDAVAALLERRGDYNDAVRTTRDDLARNLERALGLAPGTAPEIIVCEAARRQPIDEAALLRLLTTHALPPGGGPAAFLKFLNGLEFAYHDFFRPGTRR